MRDRVEATQEAVQTFDLTMSVYRFSPAEKDPKPTLQNLLPEIRTLVADSTGDGFAALRRRFVPPIRA